MIQFGAKLAPGPMEEPLDSFVPTERTHVRRLHASEGVTSHLLPTFARVDLGFERGEGAWLVATNGERYLDFTSGVAANALGHAHPHVAQAIAEQAAKLIHVRARGREHRWGAAIPSLPRPDRHSAAGVERASSRRAAP